MQISIPQKGPDLSFDLARAAASRGAALAPQGVVAQRVPVPAASSGRPSAGLGAAAEAELGVDDLPAKDVKHLFRFLGVGAWRCYCIDVVPGTVAALLSCCASIALVPRLYGYST